MAIVLTMQGAVPPLEMILQGFRVYVNEKEMCAWVGDMHVKLRLCTEERLQDLECKNPDDC